MRSCTIFAAGSFPTFMASRSFLNCSACLTGSMMTFGIGLLLAGMKTGGPREPPAVRTVLRRLGDRGLSLHGRRGAARAQNLVDFALGRSGLDCPDNIALAHAESNARGEEARANKRGVA